MNGTEEQDGEFILYPCTMLKRFLGLSGHVCSCAGELCCSLHPRTGAGHGAGARQLPVVVGLVSSDPALSHAAPVPRRAQAQHPSSGS